jgi:SSS family solute:Na+ symporter/sodium/proline symporter
MLLLVGNQGMYQKFFSARSEKDARYAVYGWIVGTLLLETLLITLAVIGSSRFPTDKPREIIALSARRGLPTLIGAILLGGIFAKVISTANNYLFSPATNLIHDVYARFINPQASQKRMLIVSRLLVVALGIFALLQATQFESILNASLYAYTVTSIALGTIITVAWNVAQEHGWKNDTDAVYPALAASVVSLILISLLTAKPDPAKWKPFFEEASKV